MNGTVSSLLIVVLVVYAVCCAFLYAIQRSFIYYPTPESTNPAAEDLRIASGGETLQVWQVNPGRSQAIVYFGGNAEDVALNTPMFAGIFPDFTVYLVNYRGYGASTGSPSEAGLFADAEAIYDAISGSHNAISLIGRSLGSSVATHLASTRDVERLVLVTPFDSIARVAAGAMPLFPVNWLLKDRFDSSRLAPAMNIPTLAVVAEHDSVIPRARSEALVAAFQPGVVNAIVIPATDHNTIGAMISYWDGLREFLARDRGQGGES